MLTSTYQPGTSLLHRSGAGVKLLGLLVFSTLLVALQSPVVVLVGAVLVAMLYGIAGFGARTLVGQVWPLRWFVGSSRGTIRWAPWSPPGHVAPGP